MDTANLHATTLGGNCISLRLLCVEIPSGNPPAAGHRKLLSNSLKSYSHSTPTPIIGQTTHPRSQMRLHDTPRTPYHLTLTTCHGLHTLTLTMTAHALTRSYLHSHAHPHRSVNKLRSQCGHAPPRPSVLSFATTAAACTHSMEQHPAYAQCSRGTLRELHHPTSAPPHDCTHARSHHCSTAPLHHCSTTPLLDCTTARLHHC